MFVTLFYIIEKKKGISKVKLSCIISYNVKILINAISF